MSQAAVPAELEEEIAAVAERAACELVHCEFAGGTLRVVLDRPEGVTLDDCQTVARETSALLDVADFGVGRYTLEVSSPGLDRKFYRRQDYERFTGSLVKMTWRTPEMAHKKTVIGRLTEYRPAGDGEVELIDASTGEAHLLPLPQILVTRLEPEI